MGKRELVLIAVFVLLGAGVYQMTAPPPPPGSDLSAGGIFQRLRRSVQGARQSGTAESTQTVAVDPSVRQLRLNLRPGDLTITAADRPDIAIELRVSARGFTAEEAKAAADAAKIRMERNGDAMVGTSVWPATRVRGGEPFITQSVVTLIIPRRMAVRLEPHTGTLTTTDLASLEVMSSRGETHVTNTAGDVVLTHFGANTIEVVGAATLKLTSRNSRGEIAKIGGLTRLDVNRSRLKISDVTGPLEIESVNSELSLEKIPALRPGLRYNGNGGELRIDGLRVESRIDGRNTDINVKLDAAAAVTIYNLGAITVTAPPDGYTLDAVAAEGRIETEDSNITATPGSGTDARASAKIRGGGPTLTLRATRGRIEVRKNSNQ